MTDIQHIVIAGSGILGLTTAWTLAENLSPAQNIKITVIGEYGPHCSNMNISMTSSNKYTSPWAGAHFRPFPSKSATEYSEMKLTRSTLAKFKEISQLFPESTIRFVKGIEVLESPDEYYRNVKPGWKEGIDGFKVTRNGNGGDGVMEAEYETWILNAPMYLQFIYRKLLIEYNVNFMKFRLKSLDQINDLFQENPVVIVNCTGTGLQYRGGYDPECYPIRGQTLLINPPKDCPYMDKTITYQLKDGSWSFVIPRPLNGGVILGGMKQVGDSFLGINEEDTEKLVEMGKKYFPGLMKTDKSGGKPYFEILNVNVGLRPARKSGLNISVEKHEHNYVIHNYGAGGMGYELSYGASVKVYEKLLEIIGRNVHL